MLRFLMKDTCVKRNLCSFSHQLLLFIFPQAATDFKLDLCEDKALIQQKEGSENMKHTCMHKFPGDRCHKFKLLLVRRHMVFKEVLSLNLIVS